MGTQEYDFSISNLRIDLKKAAASNGTPLRTRGKRQCQNTQQAPQEHTLHHKQKQILNQKSRITRHLPRSSSTLSSPSFSPQLGPRRKSHYPRPLSTIERLPFDIAEQIFLESLNVNFLRAVQRIGQILSTERVYKHFCYKVYCQNVKRNNERPITLSPAAALKHRTERQRISMEKEQMWKVRSLGLTCRWATYAFFKNLHAQTLKSPSLWLGLFSCAIPRKLLKTPPDPQSRKLLLALASLGGKVDPAGLAREDADALWTWAALHRDFYILQCMMEPRFEFKPCRDQRIEVLETTNYDVDIVKLFKETRAQDPRNGWMWSSEWPEGWPIGDSKVEAELSERHDVELSQLKELVSHGKYTREWKVGFGGDIPDASGYLVEI